MHDSNPDSPHRVLKALADELHHISDAATAKAVTPHRLLAAMPNLLPSAGVGQHNDAAEFLDNLLSCLADDPKLPMWGSQM
jgi:hypothetical protein